MIEKYLNITWAVQQSAVFCGPATAEMFLSWFGVAATQAQLWAEVETHSDGKGDGPISFPLQVCENCGTAQSPDWRCWSTTPEALEKVVELHAPATVTLRTEYAATYPDGLARLIDSLDRSPETPPFATLYSINHWVVVNGYRREDLTSQAFPPVTAGKYHVNGVYILDPQQEDAVERVRLIAASASAGSSNWSAMFGLVPCGDHVDHHPMVVGAPKGGFTKWMFLVIVAILVFWWLWYWL